MLKYTEYSQTTGITKQYGQSTTHFPNVYTGHETTNTDILQLQLEIREFAAQRDWDPFHTPRNLCLALGGELGELVEQLFLLETLQQDKLYQEVADVTIYLLRLADVCHLPLFSDATTTPSHNDEVCDTDASVLSLQLIVQSQNKASATTDSLYPAGLIRDCILRLWIHWTRNEKDLFIETLQHTSTLLRCCLIKPAAIVTVTSTSRLPVLCLLGELSDQFQFLGDNEQPLRNYTMICQYLQQIMALQHFHEETKAPEML